MVASVNGGNGAHTNTELEGLVVKVNDHGLVLDGRASWLNISKFAPEVLMPPVGARVRLTLDKAGYIRGIDAIDHPPTEPAQIHGSGAPAAGSGVPSKDVTITRLAVLKAAAQFCQFRQDVTAEDVLAISEQWEGWVTR